MAATGKQGEATTETAISQLPKYRINTIAHPPQHGTPTVGWLVIGAAERREQGKAHAKREPQEARANWHTGIGMLSTMATVGS